MNIMTRLALRQMRLAKRRTIVTILGVIISVAMITAVSTFAGSFMEMFQRLEIDRNGDWHAEFEGVAASDLDAVIGMEKAAGYILTQDKGCHQFAEKMGGKNFLWVAGLEASNLDAAGVKVASGRLPENDRELVVTSGLEARGVTGYALGDVVSLDMGHRYHENGDKLDGMDWYSEDVEHFVPEESRTYTIVGIADMGIFEEDWHTSFFSFTTADTKTPAAGTLFDVKVKMDPLDKGIYEECNALFSEISASKCDFNQQVLFYSGISDDHSLMLTFYLVGGILILIIMIGSVALIYNAFAIAISERSRQFGMLASVGATGRQKRNAVFAEAGLISLVAIPLGIVFGLVGIGITFRIVSPMLAGSMQEENASLSLVVLPSALIAAVAVSLLTIFISAWIPAKRAAGITPIDAIRTSKDIRLSRKTVKTSRLTRSLFGFEAEIALKNLKRNRKRYWITLFSLIVSLVLFLSACSFTYYMKGAYGMTQDESDYDLAATVYSRDGNHLEEQEALMAEMFGMPGVDSMIGEFNVPIERVGSDAANFSDDVMSRYEEERQGSSEESMMSGRLLGLDDETMKAYGAGLGLGWEQLNDVQNPVAIVVNERVYKKESEYSTIKLFKDGTESIDLEFYYGSEVSVPPKEVGVAALTGETPFGVGEKSDSYQDVSVYVTMDVFKSLSMATEQQMSPVMRTYVTCQDALQMELAVNELLAKPKYGSLQSSIYNVSRNMQQTQNMFMVVDIFVFGFVTLIALIGTANIFNTISTSLALRKREFAMLKSVGMTPGSFNKMIRFESLFYGIKAIVYGLPISFGVMALIYLALSRNFDAVFSVPWSSVAAGVILIFVIVSLTMLYASRKLRKDNIVEALRSDNI